MHLQNRKLPTSGKLEIEERDDAILIFGHVASEYEKKAIVEQAYKVPGVSRVVAKVTVTSVDREWEKQQDEEVGIRAWLTNPLALMAAVGLAAFFAGWFVHGYFTPVANSPTATVPGPAAAKLQPTISAEDYVENMKAQGAKRAERIQPDAREKSDQAVAAASASAAPVEVASIPEKPAGIPSTEKEVVFQLLIDGEPAVGAYVTLIAQQPELINPFFVVVKNADGTFPIPRKKLPDGGAHEFAMTVKWFKMVGTGEDAHAGPNLVAAKYGKPDKTPLRVMIDAAAESTDPIHVE